MKEAWSRGPPELPPGRTHLGWGLAEVASECLSCRQKPWLFSYPCFDYFANSSHTIFVKQTVANTVVSVLEFRGMWEGLFFSSWNNMLTRFLWIATLLSTFTSNSIYISKQASKLFRNKFYKVVYCDWFSWLPCSECLKYHNFSFSDFWSTISYFFCL